MLHKYMCLGLLTLIVAGEPACKQKTSEQEFTYKPAPHACRFDLTVYQDMIGDDQFADHVEAFRTGDTSKMESARVLSDFWNKDNCQDLTGLDFKTAALGGLYQFYEKACRKINPTDQQLASLLADVRRTNDPEVAQMLTVAWICYKMHNDPSLQEQVPTQL